MPNRLVSSVPSAYFSSYKLNHICLFSRPSMTVIFIIVLTQFEKYNFVPCSLGKNYAKKDYLFLIQGWMFWKDYIWGKNHRIKQNHQKLESLFRF